MRTPLLAALLLAIAPVVAVASPCQQGSVFEDRNGNGRRDAGERGLAGIRVSDGTQVVVTDREGRFQLPGEAAMVTVVKPAGYRAAARADGLPDIWRQAGQADTDTAGACRAFALVPEPRAPQTLKALVMADSQTASQLDVDYFRRDIIEPLRGRHGAQLGMTLGDITNDDPSLYPRWWRRPRRWACHGCTYPATTTWTWMQPVMPTRCAATTAISARTPMPGKNSRWCSLAWTT